MKTLGQHIRELRDHKGISLREFARRIGGLSAAFVSDVELGRRHPSDAVLAVMAKELGTTVEKLKAYDTRAPIEELKQLSTADPAFGAVFRKLVGKDVKAEDLLRFLDRQPDKPRNKT